MKFKLDKEFERLIPPPSPEEYAGLKQLIQDDGILDSFKVWKGHGLLVDGYTRVRIAKELDLDLDDVPVEELEFTDRTDAILWMLHNQLGRRNVSPLQRTALLTQILKHTEDDTAAAAKALGVSRRTAQRDRTVSRAVELLPEEVKDRIHKGNLPVTKKELKRFAGLDEVQRSEVIKKIVDSPETPFHEAMPAEPARSSISPEDMEFFKSCPYLSPVTRQRLDTGNIRVTKSSIEQYKTLSGSMQQLVDDIFCGNEDACDLGDAIQTATRNFTAKPRIGKGAPELNEEIGKTFDRLIRMFDELCGIYNDSSLNHRDDCVSALKLCKGEWLQWKKRYQ